MIIQTEKDRISVGQWYKAIKGKDIKSGKSFMIVMEEFPEEVMKEVIEIEKINIDIYEHNSKIEDKSKHKEFHPWPERRIVCSWKGVISTSEIDEIVEKGKTPKGFSTTKSYLINNCICDIEHVMETNKGDDGEN